MVPKRLQVQETIRRYQQIDGIISQTISKKPQFKELLTEKLDKVLFNIISNAFKYTPDGGLIHVSILKNTDKIEINIADNGIGMNAEEKAHAFDLFYRGNKNISLGTGLGLALSQEFVTLHGGEISINSEKDKGTTFKIILPIIETKQVLEEKFAMISSKIIREFEDNEANLIKNNAKHTFENTIVHVLFQLVFLKQRLVHLGDLNAP